MQALENDFKKSGGRFEKYKIENVLNWQTQKEIDPLKLDVLTINNKKKFPFYGQATINNGVISYESLTEDVLNNKDGKPTILIHSNNQNCVYLETPFYLKDGHGATSVLQCENMNEKNALFLIATISKVITQKYSYQVKATKIELKNTTIFLPVQSDDQIDFSYMEKYISEIENMRIKELEEERTKELNAYLQASGFDNYKLTRAEQIALDKFQNGEVKFKEFRIGDLFEIEKGKRLTKGNMKPGNVNFLGAISINNGIRQKIETDIIWNGNCISVNYNGSVGYSFYQEDSFYASDDVNICYIKQLTLNREIALYFCSTFFKYAQKYSYTHKWTKEKMKETIISLPIFSDGKIDYNFMQTFITAQEKLAIKNVVLWKDKIIEKTKEAIS